MARKVQGSCYCTCRVMANSRGYHIRRRYSCGLAFHLSYAFCIICPFAACSQRTCCTTPYWRL